MRRTALMVCCAATVVVACAQPPDMPAGGTPEPSTPPPPAALQNAENRILLARARALEAPVVILQVVARPERTTEAIEGLEALGGVLGASALSAGSLRVSMPTENVERAAALPAVASVTIEPIPPRGLTTPTPPPPR